MADDLIVLVWILGLMCWTEGRDVNIALGKPAWTSLGNSPGWTPDNAVDGNNDIKGESQTCFHAAGSPSDWTVDLEQNYQLYSIRVYIRNTFNSRIANSIIYLDKNPSRVCYTFPSAVSSNPLDVACNGTARYVTIRNPGNGPDFDDALNICEVEIYVCSSGTYSFYCSATCGYCASPTCDRWTGFCSGDCVAGYRGNKCDSACNKTTYGVNCKGECADRKCNTSIGSCDRVTGSCDGGCVPGWMGSDCSKACGDQYYGSNCSSICEDRHCYGNSTCDHVTGSCDKGCEAGWKGTDCRERCDREHYGRNCEGICASRHCEGSSSCSPSTGQCDGGCQTGWTGVNCTNEKFMQTPAAEDRTAIIAVSVMAVIIVILVLVVIAVIVWRRKRPDLAATNSSTVYNMASQSVKVKVKDESSEIRTDQSPSEFHFNPGYEAPSRDPDHTYTSINNVHHDDQIQTVVTGGDDYEPVP